MTDNKKLIEEALTAYWGGADNAKESGSVEGIRAALAVFEKAHTPTDDEREALTYLITAFRFRERGLRGTAMEPDLAVSRPLAEFLLAEGFRRTEIPEPSAGGYAEFEGWEQEMFRHQPVLSMRDGSIAGCQCLDRVFVKGREDWGTHLATIITSRLTAEPQGESSDAQVSAIKELEREIPDAYVDGSGSPVIILTEQAATTALAALRAAGVPQAEPADVQEALDLKGLTEIIGDVVVDHADIGPHSQRAITIRDTCADWPDLIAGEVQAHGFRRSLPLSDEALDAAFAAFRAHERGEEFNEFGEHVCSECGYAYSWPSGIDGRQTVPARRRQRHIAREALRAAGGVR